MGSLLTFFNFFQWCFKYKSFAFFIFTPFWCAIEFCMVTKCPATLTNSIISFFSLMYVQTPWDFLLRSAMVCMYPLKTRILRSYSPSDTTETWGLWGSLDWEQGASRAGSGPYKGAPRAQWDTSETCQLWARERSFIRKKRVNIHVTFIQLSKCSAL